MRLPGEWIQFISSLPGKPTKNVLSGQMVSHLETGKYESEYYDFITALRQASGKTPAVPGVNYGYANISQIKTANAFLAAVGYKLISIHHTARNPWTGGNAHDISVTDMPHLNTCSAWLAELDKMIEAFLDLKRLGMVGILRAFPEATYGAGMWYSYDACKKDPSIFRAAWDFMRARLVVGGVDNAIWTYTCGMAYQKPNTFWPNYCDMAGLDLYADSLGYASAIEAYNQLASHSVPMGFTEIGPDSITDGSFDNMRYLEAVRTSFPRAAFVFPWSSYGGDGSRPRVHLSIIENKNAAAFMNDPHLITLEDLMAEPINYVVVVNLLPQNATKAEKAFVLDAVHDFKQTILQSADDAARMVAPGLPSSKVVVWDADRWPEGVVPWLYSRGVPLVEERKLGVGY